MTASSNVRVFAIVLTGFEPEAGASARLQQAFGVSEAMAERLVLNMPSVVKRNATEAQARAYAKRLRSIGARFELRPSNQTSPKVSVSKPQRSPSSQPEPVKGSRGASVGAVSAVKLSGVVRRPKRAASQRQAPSPARASASQPKPHAGQAPAADGGMLPIARSPGTALPLAKQGQTPSPAVAAPVGLPAGPVEAAPSVADGLPTASWLGSDALPRSTPAASTPSEVQSPFGVPVPVAGGRGVGPVAPSPRRPSASSGHVVPPAPVRVPVGGVGPYGSDPASQGEGADRKLHAFGQMPDFWASIGPSILSPFAGGGPAWLVLPVIIVGLSVCALMCGPLGLMVGGIAAFIYWGLIQLFFEQQVRVGMNRQHVPVMIDLNYVSSEWPQIVGRGFMVWVMFIGLNLPVISYISNHDNLLTGEVSESLEQEPVEETPAVLNARPLERGDVFYNKRGAKIRWTFTQDSVEAYAVRGDSSSKVILKPRERLVVSAAPPRSESNGAKMNRWSERFGKDRRFARRWAILLFLALVVPLMYIPLAMTSTAISNNGMSIFDVGFIFRGLVGGGLKYMTIMAFTAVVSGVALWVMMTGLGRGYWAMVVLPILFPPYIAGVVGFLMGRLVVNEPQAFPSVN